MLEICIAFLIQTTEAFQGIFIVSCKGNNNIADICCFLLLNAPLKVVELLCANGVMDVTIDPFGSNVQTHAGDLQNFCVVEEVIVDKMFLIWIFGFEGNVRVRVNGSEDKKTISKDE